MEHDSAGRQQFSGALVQLSFLIQRVFGQVSRDFGLTPQQAHLLGLLSCGGLGMAELGSLLYLEKSSLTGLVDRAEKRGLVTRVRDTRDRRAWRVVLTDTGGELAGRFYKEIALRVSELGDLDPAERAQVIKAIDRMVADHQALDLFASVNG